MRRAEWVLFLALLLAMVLAAALWPGLLTVSDAVPDAPQARPLGNIADNSSPPGTDPCVSNVCLGFRNREATGR